MIYLYKQIIMFENLTTMKKNVSLIEIISTNKYVSTILLIMIAKVQNNFKLILHDFAGLHLC